MRSRSTTLSLGTVALAAALALTGCSSTGGDTKGDAAPSAGSSSQAPTPMDRLTSAKKVMDQTSGMHLKLTSNDVPKGATGVLSGSGDGSHAPAFKGKLKAQVGPIASEVPIRAVDGNVWAKLPIWPKMRKVDPADYGAPDPAQLFSTDHGISSLLPQTKATKFGEQKRNGADTVQVITGTLPGKVVTSVLAIGKTSATYDVTYQVTDDNELREAVVTGPFFPKAKNTSYTLTLTEYGTKVDVQAP